MSPKAFWFLVITFYVGSANPGADAPTNRRVDVNQPIQCSTYRTVEAGPQQVAARPEKDQQLILQRRSSASIKRKLIVNDDVELDMKCFWEAEIYRCEWSEYYFVEFYVDEVWTPMSKHGKSKWLLFRANWSKGPIESTKEMIHCGQRV
ncbi:MAG: hypothetical protein CL677_04360 [Bdellovibrionaceae bacterium]|nr:hypothetical protein [Pseudobdellovibrionaceae bacterium]